jgi:hypothetical protein
MAEQPKKTGIWVPPFIALLVWEAVYLAFEFLFPQGATKLLFEPVLFFGEFALVFSLSLWLSANLSRKRGFGLMEAARGFAVFFAAFSLLALAATLMTTADISDFGSLINSIAIYALLDMIKLALGLLGLAIGVFIPPQGKWEGFVMWGAALSALAFAAALIAGFIIGFYLSTSFDFQSSDGFSLSAGNCTPGEWAYIKVFGLGFNITVTGLETYRERQACHAAGASDSPGSNLIIDVYGQDEDNICYVTTTTSRYNTTKAKEKCTGDWPGYAGETG